VSEAIERRAFGVSTLSNRSKVQSPRSGAALLPSFLHDVLKRLHRFPTPTNRLGPERLAADIPPESGADGVFPTGAGRREEKSFVLRQEARAFAAELGEERLAQEEAEGVGEIVERDFGDEEVQLRGPEPGVLAAGLQRLPVNFALGLGHHLAQARYAHDAGLAFLVESTLEQEAHR